MDNKTKVQETTSRRCSDCLYCVKDEGEPYYCAIRDLFYFVDADDEACADLSKLPYRAVLFFCLLTNKFVDITVKKWYNKLVRESETHETSQ